MDSLKDWDHQINFKSLLGVNNRRPETGSLELPSLLLLMEAENALGLCIWITKWTRKIM